MSLLRIDVCCCLGHEAQSDGISRRLRVKFFGRVPGAPGKLAATKAAAVLLRLFVREAEEKILHATHAHHHLRSAVVSGVHPVCAWIEGLKCSISLPSKINFVSSATATQGS
jgi:hypothetical protein